MMRKTLAGAALAAGLAILAMPVAAQADPINLTIGKLLEVTGPLSDLGPSQDKAIKIAIAYANEQAVKAAGVDITAKDVGADVQGDPQAALSAARTLVDQGASCLIGPAITPESIAIANGLTIRKRVTIWPVGTSMRLRTIKDEGTIFRTVPADSLQALALAAAIADKLGTAEGKRSPSSIATSPMASSCRRVSPRLGQPRAARSRGRSSSTRPRRPSIPRPARSSPTIPMPICHRLSRYLRQARRGAGADRQVRSVQGLRR